MNHSFVVFMAPLLDIFSWENQNVLVVDFPTALFEGYLGPFPGPSLDGMQRRADRK